MKQTLHTYELSCEDNVRRIIRASGGEEKALTSGSVKQNH